MLFFSLLWGSVSVALEVSFICRQYTRFWNISSPSYLTHTHTHILSFPLTSRCSTHSHHDLRAAHSFHLWPLLPWRPTEYPWCHLNCHVPFVWACFPVMSLSLCVCVCVCANNTPDPDCFCVIKVVLIFDCQLKYCDPPRKSLTPNLSITICIAPRCPYASKASIPTSKWPHAKIFMLLAHSD